MLRTIFGLSCILGFTWFALFSNYAAMLMYWWFAVFRPQEWMWWDLSYLRLPTIAAALFFIPSLINRHSPFWRNALCIIMFAFMAQIFLSEQLMGCAGTVLDIVNTRTLKVGLVLILAALISARICKTPTQILGWILLVIVSLSFLNAKLGLAAILTGKTLYNIEIGGGGFAGTNNAAMGGVMTFILALFMMQIALFKDKIYLPNIKFRNVSIWVVRLLLLIIIMGLAAFVVATESRGSGLALGLATAVWMLLHQKRLRVVMVASVIALVVLGTVGIPEGYKERLATAFIDIDEQEDISVQSRPHFWNAAKSMARDNPMGIGIGCYKAYYDFYDTSRGHFGTQRSVHSSHYAILAELGYPGFAMWVALFVIAFWKLFKLRYRWANYLDKEKHAYMFYYFANACIALKIGFLFGGSFYEMWLNDITWMVFAMVIAVERFSSVEYEIVKARERMLQAELKV